MHEPLHVLLVEDEPLVARELRAMLELLGYAVSQAASVPEAQRQLADAVFHLAVLDIELPGPHDGIDLAAALNARQPPLPFLFASSHADAATIERVKAVRPYGYLVKPFDHEDVYVATELALATHAHRFPAAAPAPAATGTVLPPKQLQRVTEYVQQGLDKEFTVEELAGVVGLGAAHFAKLFRRTVGTSPYQFVMAQRVQQAQHLLVATSDTLADVAVQLGFYDQSHFTKVFRRLTGQTPQAFRQQHASIL